MTLKSMTAFGSSEWRTEQFIYRCDIRTLNARFCDVSIKLPRSLLSFEPQLMQRTKDRLLRGKIDIFVDVIPLDKSSLLPHLNVAAIEHYRDLACQLQKQVSSQLKPLSVAEFLRLEGVLENTSTYSKNQDLLQVHADGLDKVIDLAFSAVLKQRLGEGEALSTALSKILELIREQTDIIDSKREIIQVQVYGNYKKRLERILQVIEDTGKNSDLHLPEERLLSEVVMLTDRSDIEEEVTRLKAHEQEFRRLLNGGSEVGRRMDFLCQEMHREVNTISSKLTQLEVSQHSLLLKQNVERLRQQVQNIE